MTQDPLEIAFEKIKEKLLEYKGQGKTLFASSSFQTHSLPMLHIISRIDPEIPVYFINTGYHFPETVEFKDKVARQFGLKLLNLASFIPKVQQRDEHGYLYFASDPDYCCYLNKIQPMDQLLLSKDVWINGIRGDQNANRKNMGEEAKTPQGGLRYHPMLHWTSKMVYEYSRKYQLPTHPLESKGYLSIGCEPCTSKFSFGDERGSRWQGMKKSECGLHTDLVVKK